VQIVFFLRHPLYLRNYESALRALAEKNHTIRLVFSPLEKQVDRTLLAALKADYPNIVELAVGARRGWWWPVSDAVRTFRDYLRYLEPEYAQAKALLDRGSRRLPHRMRVLFERVNVLRSKPVRRGLASLAKLFDRAIPPDPGILATLRRWSPDLLVVTPMVDFTYAQTDYVKAARYLKIPTVLAVASWDNLTNKGLIQVWPERVILWNDIQADEAVRMHGIPAERIVKTGAQLFDHWFDMSPSSTRKAFCAWAGGLDPKKPIILYLCSSSFICRDEVSFVRKWLEELRAADDPLVREANVIVRPHPAHVAQWKNVDLSKYGRVVVWPREGGVPVDAERKKDYFDSLYHAAAVVGINTTGFIEAAIIGRRTLTLATDEPQITQEQTLHFHYLTQAGVLRVARSFREHLAELSRVLADRKKTNQDFRKFLTEFVRPHGLDRPATPFFVDAVESSAALQPSGWRVPLYAPLLRALSWPLALPVRRIVLERLNKGMYHGIERTGFPRFVAPRGQATEHSDRKVRQFIKFTHRTLAKLADSDKPIIVGPWLSEVGFELLYWIPMVRWAQQTYGLDRERLIVVSRGGVAGWYGEIANRYCELFDFFNPEEFATFNKERQKASGMQKQKQISPVEGELLKRVQQSLGLDDCELLHPNVMYSGMLRYHWSQRSSMDHLLLHTRYEKMDIPEPGEIEARLPRNYYAVRFYTRESFNDSPDSRKFVRGLLEQMLERRDVVLLDSPFKIDDHDNVEWAKAAGNGTKFNNRLIQAADWMTPANNLDVQTRIIARSRGFVGTYGGLSYLAPFFGKPSIAFHERTDDVMDAHVNTAMTVFRGMNAPFILLTLDEAELVRELI